MLLKRCKSLCCRRLLAREGIELRPEFLPLHEAVGRQVLVGASLALNLVDPIRERPCLFLEAPQRPVKLSRGGKPFHVDIWVERNGEVLAIELKYKTKALQTSERGEEFVLQNHSAQHIARYDFIKDVWRVETIVANYTHASGYAILLTNDPSYWTQSHNSRTVDAAFRLHQGQKLHGTLDWGAHASEGTKRGREKPLRLVGSYLLQWVDFSRATAEAKCAEFRYLVVEVVMSQMLGWSYRAAGRLFLIAGEGSHK